MGDLGETKTDLFLQRDLDDPNQLEIVQEFSLCAQWPQGGLATRPP
jgi:hypothetical protein